MYDLIKKAVHDDEAAIELSKSKKDVTEVVDAISQLSLDQTMALGMKFKRFPLGCDLTEIVVGTCASDLELKDLLGNCRVANMIGAPIHICAYAFSDIADNYDLRGIDVMKKVHDIVDVPLDLDHFGENGPMKFPRNIVRCGGECYNKGPAFTECPRGRIHERLIDKEKLETPDKEEWVKLSSSVAVNVTSEQTGEGHAAPFREAQDVASLAKKYGKGLESIMFVGDGYDEVITGFEKSLELGADIFVIEGGPFNRTENTVEAYSKAIAAARILAPGKVVATNGAYEEECRAGLRSGLNMIISGFPGNHHGYMCGYEPGTAKRGKFGLPRVIQIMSEEIQATHTRVPVQREELLALSTAVKFAGPENIYPKTIGNYTVGDAHWATLTSSKMYDEIVLKKSLEEIVNSINGDSVALLGGRFISWVIANEIDKQVDEIVISDVDPWVQKMTVDNLSSCLDSTVIAADSDKQASNETDSSIITSTVPAISNKILNNIPNAINIV